MEREGIYQLFGPVKFTFSSSKIAVRYTDIQLRHQLVIELVFKDRDTNNL